MSRRILYVQHAGSPGGSVVSLRYLIEGMIAAGHTVAVAMVEPNREVRTLYETCGATVFDAPEIPLFRHTTAGWARFGDPRACVYQARAFVKRSAGIARLRQLIDTWKPDIVHLNSVTLAMAANGLSGCGTPIVWHVRESPVPGYCGMRLRYLRESLLREADEIIFLSESDREAWVQGQRGQVVHNVVPLSEQPSERAIGWERERFGLDAGDRAVAYVGGLAEIKGIFPLIAAVRELLPKFPRLRIVAPGTELPEPRSLKARIARTVLPSLGLARDYERADKAIRSPELASVFRRCPFAQHILPVIAACEFLVFPSTRPHFARPVVEAANVGRPAIGSDLGGVCDLIESGRTGVLVPARNPKALAAAMEQLLSAPARTAAMGQAARELARERFDAAAQVNRIAGIYEAVSRRGVRPNEAINERSATA
ncbi:MAG: glycosyltransferase family 4 protein [Planctomycetia bacterium]